MVSLANGPFQCLTLSLLILPPILLTTYFLAAFPSPPEPLIIYPSLELLPKAHASWDIYPEDFYQGGAYARFPYGKVRYWLIGPEDGKKVVLIHGLSIPAMIWKDVAPVLASRGYRVLLYDLYGRGYSDAPSTTYSAALYTAQLALLMQHIKWDKAHVVGVSMGGAIAAAFTSHFPHLVEDRVVLIACAGIMESSDLPRTAKFMSSPLVQTLTGSSIVRSYLQHLISSKGNTSLMVSAHVVTEAGTSGQQPLTGQGEAEATDSVKVFTAKEAGDGRIQEIVRIQSAHLPGYNAAVASSLRDGPIRGLTSAFAEGDAWSSKRVVLIHGTKDNTVPYKYAARIKETIERGVGERNAGAVKVVTVEGGKHDLTVSHPKLVVDEISGLFL
ncbi:AB hydrolase superfamily protein [Pleurotus pulmonarius]